MRPLFIAGYDGDVCFASEGKALLRHPRAERALDPIGIVDIFTTWSTLPDHSALAGIRELPPAHYMIIGPMGIRVQKRWWDIEFESSPAPAEQLLAELEALMADAIRLRLRADVAVATYLSGGLDSSAIAAIAAAQLSRKACRRSGSDSAIAGSMKAPPKIASSRSSGPRFTGQSSTHAR